MDNVNSKFFDVPALLKLDGLNTRKFAISERRRTVDEYFSMLSNLLSLALDVEKALAEIANCSGELDDYKSLDSMVNLLTDMECDIFILEFHSLLDAYGKKGNWREAAVYAKQISKDFHVFYYRIKRAIMKAAPDNLPDLTIPLNKYIKQLDAEEADRKPLVLAVDDSPVILSSVSSVLSSDYKVFTLAKPTELEKVLQKLIPELFIIDYLMPELNGFDLIPIIRSFAEHKNTPIVFLTSEGTFDNVTAALALGACDFIIKPFNPDLLREKIAKHIVKKKLF